MVWGGVGCGMMSCSGTRIQGYNMGWCGVFGSVGCVWYSMGLGGV